MEELRQKLIDAGWRQGALVEPGLFGDAEACAFVVMNQTCDCLNPKIETEPWLELLPLVTDRQAGFPHEKRQESLGAHDRDIDSILISLTPFAELSEEEGYEIELHLMIEPAVMARSADVAALTVIASDLKTILEESPDIASATCHVTSLDMMTLWEAKQFLDFTRYDYLSFGQDEAASEPSDP